MKVRKITLSAPFIVGREIKEMLDCDLPRITQEILDEMGDGFFAFAFLDTVRCSGMKRDPSFFN